MYDYNSITSNVLIGDCLIPLISLLGRIGQEVPLESVIVDRKGVAAGKVTIYIMLEVDNRPKKLETSSSTAMRASMADAVVNVISSEPKRRSKKAPNIMDRFYACEKGGKIDLDIAQLKLMEWPNETVIFPKLRRLQAFNNQLSTAPAIGDLFRNLTYLDISRNLLSNIESIKFCQLTNLSHLDISRNFLTSLPEDIVKLPQLEVLSIHRNRIQCFPSGMKELKSLKVVNAESNEIVNISVEFDSLQWLAELNLADNPSLDFTTMSPRTKRLCEKV